MNPMNETEKDTIYWLVQRAVMADAGPDKVMTGRACLPWMVHGAIVLGQFGIRSIPQAGSAWFRFLPAHLDDGVCDTHHAFEWSPRTPQSMQQIARGQLPEIHCWLALPDSREIIDFSTGYIHHGCPHPWQADPLPRYVWLPEGEGHPGCLYKPEMEAIKFLINFMKAKALLHAI